MNLKEIINDWKILNETRSTMVFVTFSLLSYHKNVNTSFIIFCNLVGKMSSQ